MHRRRISSTYHEQLAAREKVLTDIIECEDEGNTTEDTTTSYSKSVSDDSSQSGIPFLHQVVLDGDLELLGKLIQSGSDVNVCDDEGWPPLNTAIRHGKSECAALLLKHGAGDFFFQRQKEQYLQRLQVSKKTRRKSHWM